MIIIEGVNAAAADKKSLAIGMSIAELDELRKAVAEDGHQVFGWEGDETSLVIFIAQDEDHLVEIVGPMIGDDTEVMIDGRTIEG